MTLQNRVTPLGELVANPARGLVYGNRGCLHDDAGRMRRHHNGRRWIACRLRFRGWHRSPLLQPGKFTELFFLAEATALAAGHRPCALCRHDDYAHLVSMWIELHPDQVGAEAIDGQLHRERFDRAARRARPPEAPFASLPTGAFVLWKRVPHVVLEDRLARWTASGYAAPVPRPRGGRATVVTPPSLLELLRTERTPLVPLLHPTAAAAT